MKTTSAIGKSLPASRSPNPLTMYSILPSKITGLIMQRDCCDGPHLSARDSGSAQARPWRSFSPNNTQIIVPCLTINNAAAASNNYSKADARALLLFGCREGQRWLLKTLEKSSRNDPSIFFPPFPLSLVDGRRPVILAACAAGQMIVDGPLDSLPSPRSFRRLGRGTFSPRI